MWETYQIHKDQLTQLINNTFNNYGLQRPSATRIIDRLEYKRYQMKRYLIDYKSNLSFAQNFFVQRELQAYKYSFITYVWSRVDEFFVTQCMCCS